LTFNEDVIAQGNFIKIFRTDNSSLVAIYYATDTNFITIDHNKVIIKNPDLIQGVSYAIQIPQGTFADSDGNESAGIEDTTAWNFTTINPDPKPFISEYLNGGDGQMAIEVYFPNDGTYQQKSDYTLEVVQWSSANGVINKEEVPLYPSWTGTVNIIVDALFYEFFDITKAPYYNEEAFLDYDINCALVLKDGMGQIVDVVGNKDANASSHGELLSDGKTMIRKPGLHAGNINYNAKEWYFFSDNIYWNIGYPTP
ncbi:MAG TPA: Ig-like domain-containing protein, partial [Rummeliibacillus sp.]|nr:Ig-like domain-containing protein [Rummeliibacillus sp.]